MSKNVHTKPGAQRIDSQDEVVASSVEATEQREATAQDQASVAVGESPAPKPRTTRNRLLTITQRFATFRTRLPIWSLLVLALLFGIRARLWRGSGCDRRGRGRGLRPLDRRRFDALALGRADDRPERRRYVLPTG